MTANKIKGKRTVTTFAAVEDEGWQPAPGATVQVDWSLPDGTKLTLESTTSSTGLARYDLRNAKSGVHALTVNDVQLAEHRFDTDSSVLSASIKVK
jgi:hypothetical protein